MKNTIYVVVLGGVVQTVTSIPSGVEVVVLDYDVEDASAERLAISPLDGEPCALARYTNGC